MKKLLIIIIIASIGICKAQSTFKIGPKATIGSSWLGIKELEGTGYYTAGSNLCWSAGLVTEISISKNIYLQPEILFAQNSGSYLYEVKGVIPNGSASVSYFYYDPIKLSQIQLPLNIKIKIRKFYFMSAPTYSLMFGNKNDVHLKNSTSHSYKKFDKDDLALSNSLGIEINKKPSISIEIRHYRGFAKIDHIGYHQSSLSIGSSILF